MIYRKLFEPLQVKGLTLKNRIVMPPMHNNLGNMEEGITDRAVDFFAARAKGGFAMIGIGVIDTYFVQGASSPHAFYLMNDRHVEQHRKVVKEVRKCGALVYAQIGVRRIWPVQQLHRIPKLSSVPEDKVMEMQDSLVQTAVRVREAGYDALSFLGIGGGAVSIFLSKVLNDRTDQWGGSLENRSRFLLDAVKRAREILGPEYPIFLRMHGSEFLKGGYDFVEAKLIARNLEQAGIDLFNVSGGSHATSIPQLTPDVPRGNYAFLAREIKSAVSVPVAASNRINHPQVAERILQKGWSDLVSVARGSLADPEWPNKARKGDVEDIRLCIACNECLDAVVIREEPICCTVNPRVGRFPEEQPTPKASDEKRVLVIGGGCTGLQAAVTCSERGHHVTILEKAPYLGGKWRLAALPTGREELLTYLHWLVRRAKQLGIRIETEREGTPAVVQEIKPDVLFLCTGGRPRIPDIPGVGLRHVVLAQDVLDAAVDVGERVVVVGGGGVGVELALFLARRWSSTPETIAFLTEHEAFDRETVLYLKNKGHTVTLVEQLARMGEGLGPGTRWVLKKELDLAGVRMLCKAPVREIQEKVVIVDHDGERQSIEADTVVLATGFVSDESLYEKMKGMAREVYPLVAATQKGHLIHGISEAYELAMKV